MRLRFSLITLCTVILLSIPGFTPAATMAGMNPCGLIEKGKMLAAFPALKDMEQQTIGPNTTCNYLDKYGISALIISVHLDDGIKPLDMMKNLGKGYRVEAVAGLGDRAAMAISLPNAKYGIKGGGVAELYIKKGKSCLLLAPARIKIGVDGPEFVKLKVIAAEMLEKLP